MASNPTNNKQWMAPPSSVNPAGGPRPRSLEEVYAEQYLPNEPEGSEAAGMARAAGRRERQGRSDGYAQGQQPVVQPDAVLYSSAGGVQPQAVTFAENTPLPRRRRMAPLSEPAGETTLQQKAQAAKEDARLKAGEEQPAGETSLQQKAQAAKENARLKGGEEQPAGEASTRKALQRTDALQKARQGENSSSLLVNSTHTPFGLPEGVDWELNEPQLPETCKRMPPAPAEKAATARRSNGLLWALVVLMLLLAAGGYLWLSGHGSRLLHHARALFPAAETQTIQTGQMAVVPEDAAVPTVLVVTLSTDNTVVDLRLTNDDGQVLEADITCFANGEDCLWTCRLPMNEPYQGFIRALLLDHRGQWLPGSSSRHVNIN